MFDLTDDQKDLRAKARALAGGAVAARAAEVDRTEEYPWDNVALLKDAGFMGMTIPEAYGGQGRSFLDAVLVVEEMAKHCGVTGRIVVEANMGAISSVMRYGSEEQKKFCAEHVRRQARHLYYGAERRQCRDRHDDSRRQEGRHVRY